jgi:hypothetical protein
MQIKLNILIIFIVLLSTTHLFAQSREDLKSFKILTKAKYWECIELKDKTQGVSPRVIIGEVMMQFYVLKEKKVKKIRDKKGREKEKKVTETSNLFKLELRGEKKKMKFGVQDNSIVLFESEDWGNYKIIRIEKDKIVLEHELDNHTFWWTMVPLAKNRRPLDR